MARNIENEQSHLNNGNRFFLNAGEQTGIYQRDPDKLHHQYENLRNKIYGKYSYRLRDPITKSELRSYIDEQFHRLVVEYNVNQEVDFPGYIKIKLERRVRDSFLRRHKKSEDREFVPRKSDAVMNSAETVPTPDDEMDYYAIIESMLKNVPFTVLQEVVLFEVLQEKTDMEVEEAIREEYGDLFTLKDIKYNIKEIKDFIRFRLETMIKERFE